MKYDFSKVLKNLDGSDAVDGGSPATVKKGLVNALVSDPPSLSVVDKGKRYALFVKMQNDIDELSVEEVALLKSAIDIYPTLVYGQLAAFLDQSNS